MPLMKSPTAIMAAAMTMNSPRDPLVGSLLAASERMAAAACDPKKRYHGQKNIKHMHLTNLIAKLPPRSVATMAPLAPSALRCASSPRTP
eukprot:CAMPEP_0173411380 /NCGR_PEP_ID=MMETSP1356-20130122/76805_1 /TAXON_ID=77927 ORGANISM="Hemiselmis virescens, Strain PCC157" /NCGR_SAMPLE_ID=MMETSP1356 /ASSEMBLY_ACC=CAM_ASM_000847 /LENGTH=89 /DNA_ID=CAMNT_0014373131 /DNA_START=250 /DNA_END=516 /DNA_ORIENTATION=-